MRKNILSMLSSFKLNLIIILLFSVILIPFTLGWWDYLSGRFDIGGWLFFLFPLTLILFPISFFLLIRAIIDILKSKSSVLSKLSVQLFTIIYIVVLLFITFYYHQPGYKSFTAGFRDRLSTTIDVIEVRNWLKSVDPNQCNIRLFNLRRNNNRWPEDIDWPRSIRALDPTYVSLSEDYSNHPVLELTWGGPLGHWGIEIYSIDTPINLGKYAYPLPITPQAIVWHEIQ
jgi:hypothetical protein